MHRSLLQAGAMICFGLLASSALAQLSNQIVIHPPPGSLLLSPLPGATPQPIPPAATTPAPLALPPPPQILIPATQLGPIPPNILVWDSELKEHKAKVGDVAAQFSFHFTNVSPAEVTIAMVNASCGCTTVQLPPMPWKIAPGTSGEIPTKMTLTSIPGSFTKTLTVFTDKGSKMLIVKTTIDPLPAGPMTEEERKRNQELVKADRQAVFKGDCARCHVQPVIGKTGKELYDAACGICHDAEHRASMVPSLHALNHDTNAEFWQTMIVNGKDNTLMPAFSLAKGGPLSDPQIASLVDYLVKTMPAKAVSTNAVNGPPQHAGK